MIPILYQDNHVIVVEKPVGLLSQQSDKGQDNLPFRLSEDGIAVKPVHRLDRLTGGVMVYAVSDRAAATLSETVQHHDCFAKEYLAVIGENNLSSDGTLHDFLYYDRAKNRSYVVKRPRHGVKEALLDYTVLQTVTVDGNPYSLVAVRLQTGRTHQIRVQFASRKMPLIGDKHYGSCKGNGVPALWSWRLSFPHPITKETVSSVSKPDTSQFPWNLFSDTIDSLE